MLFQFHIRTWNIYSTRGTREKKEIEMKNREAGWEGKRHKRAAKNRRLNFNAVRRVFSVMYIRRCLVARLCCGARITRSFFGERGFGSRAQNRVRRKLNWKISRFPNHRANNFYCGFSSSIFNATRVTVTRIVQVRYSTVQVPNARIIM